MDLIIRYNSQIFVHFSKCRLLCLNIPMLLNFFTSECVNSKRLTPLLPFSYLHSLPEVNVILINFNSFLLVLTSSSRTVFPGFKLFDKVLKLLIISVSVLSFNVYLHILMINKALSSLEQKLLRRFSLLTMQGFFKLRVVLCVQGVSMLISLVCLIESHS